MEAQSLVLIIQASPESIWPVTVTGWLGIFTATGMLFAGLIGALWKVLSVLFTIRNELAPMEGKSIRDTLVDIDERVENLEKSEKDREIRRSNHWLFRALGD